MIPALRLILLACPPSFRRKYGGEIVALFEARLERVGDTRVRAFWLWCRTAGDLCAAALAEWCDVFLEWRRTRRLRRHHRRGSTSLMDRLTLDLRDARRRLASTPGFTGAALLILAVGIGATTAIFTAVDAFALRERPFVRPHELVHIYQDSDDGQPESNSYPAFTDISEYRDLFSAVGAVVPEGSATWLAPSGEAEVVHLEFATASYFPVLGLRPALGRWFTPVEDRPGAAPVAVLSHAAWQRRFGADPLVVGRTVRLSGAAVTIVGVGPEGYSSFVPGLVSDFWLSLSSLGPVGGPFRERTLKRREDHWFQIVARLAPGRTSGEAQAAMNTLADRLGREFPETDRGRRITVMSAADVRVHPELDAMIYPTAGLHLLLGALLMAVICSNLANLTLARGTARQRELAIRLAIGATRTQIVRSLVVETLLLAMCGGALGLVGAWWAMGAIGAWEIPLSAPARTAIALDHRVVTFAVALSIATGLAFGIVPAIWNSRTDLTRSLKPGSRAARRVLRLRDLRGALVVVQVAISLAIIACGGILLRSMMNAMRVDFGFSLDSVASMTVDATQSGRPPAQATATLVRIRDRAAALPGVAGAALATRPPLTPFGPTNTLVLDEHATHRTRSGTVEVAASGVTADYFSVLQIPMLHGRPFADGDAAGAPAVAIVSESMARAFWGTSEIVGRRYRYEGTEAWVTIIGVAKDLPIVSPGEPPRAFVYRPFAQFGFGRAGLVIRTTGDAAAVLNTVRQEIRAVDSSIPVLNAATMREHSARALAIPRAATRLLGGLGLLTILLACVGIYSIVAFSVARRRGEMGVRMALGATATQVVRMVVREMMALVVVGVIGGLILGGILAPALRSLLIGIQPLDALTFTAVAALVAATALLTAWIPARRAAEANPAAVLRAE